MDHHLVGSPADSSIPVEVPAHSRVKHQWRTEFGPREDRAFTAFEAYVPPQVADLRVEIPQQLIADCDAALNEAVRLDAEYGSRLRSLAGMMLRTEAIATSKIEDEHASTEDYIRAMYGNKANRSAIAMVRATDAIEHIVERGVSHQSLLAGHKKLMGSPNPLEPTSGEYRTLQNWIGGSDYSPRDALHIPPPRDMVGPLMDDLMAFASRDDLPAIPQAAIMHAQFENIHPFTDDNGRTGRALISALMRQRGHTKHTTIPIAAALAAQREDYFSTLWKYRDDGDAGPVISLISAAITVTSKESRVTAARLEDMPAQWNDQASRPRRDSASGKLLRHLTLRPILSAHEAEEITGSSERSAARAVTRLEDAGIIHEVTGRKRNRVWVASEVIDEIDGLAHRIEQRIRTQP